MNNANSRPPFTAVLLAILLACSGHLTAQAFDRTEQREPCTVFNTNQPAFYYARVLENPSCRWSTLHCQAAGVNPFAPIRINPAAANEVAL